MNHKKMQECYVDVVWDNEDKSSGTFIGESRELRAGVFITYPIKVVRVDELMSRLASVMNTRNDETSMRRLIIALEAELRGTT